MATTKRGGLVEPISCFVPAVTIQMLSSAKLVSDSASAILTSKFVDVQRVDGNVEVCNLRQQMVNLASLNKVHRKRHRKWQFYAVQRARQVVQAVR